MFKYATFAAIALLASFTNVDARPAALDVFVPPVTSPTTGTVWKVGTQQNVTWDTSNAPSQITNSQGRVVLAQGGELFVNQTGGLNDPLASDFDILLGSITITVPNVTAGNNYEVVLFGDSGDITPDFTIEA